MVSAAKAQGLDVVSIDGADGWAWGSCLMSMVVARMSGDPHWVSKAVEGKAKFSDKVFVDSLAFIQRALRTGDRLEVRARGLRRQPLQLQQREGPLHGPGAVGRRQHREPAVAENTLMMAWPKLPGEKEATAGSVAAAIQVGYGITKAGAADPKVATRR